MIAVDTNILVRYAVKDDFQQTIIATDFLANNKCFVLKTVLLELVWVLSSSGGYALPRNIVCERVKHILGLPNVVMDDENNVVLAVDWYESGMDFADALHLSLSLGLKGFATFEKKIAKKSEKLNVNQNIILLSKESAL